MGFRPKLILFKPLTYTPPSSVVSLAFSSSSSPLLFYWLHLRLSLFLSDHMPPVDAELPFAVDVFKRRRCARCHIRRKNDLKGELESGECLKLVIGLLQERCLKWLVWGKIKSSGGYEPSNSLNSLLCL